MPKSVSPSVLIVAGLLSLSACSKSPKSFSWKEEVRLNDESVIVVTQRRSCDLPIQSEKSFGCIEREAWVTLDMPQFSPQAIVWNEKLHPRIVNVYNGKLYIVGSPPTERESRLYEIYAKPVSPYLSFLWDKGQWNRIPLAQVPEAIYGTNMLIEGIPPKDVSVLTVEVKESRKVNGNGQYAKHLKRVDPTYIRPELPQSKE
jgi:hypothetical protein